MIRREPGNANLAAPMAPIAGPMRQATPMKIIDYARGHRRSQRSPQKQPAAASKAGKVIGKMRLRIELSIYKTKSFQNLV
jgi:hypothetical protein